MLLRHTIKRKTSGQAMTETVIIMPVMLLLVFGMLQLAMLSHARIMVEYAAHNACRAGIVNNGDTSVMINAALISTLPLYGRTDTLTNALATYTIIGTQVLAGQAIGHLVDEVAEEIRNVIGLNIGAFLPPTSLVDVTIATPSDEMFLQEASDAQEMDFDAVQDLDHFLRNFLSAEVNVMVPLRVPIFDRVMYELYMARMLVGDGGDLAFNRSGKVLNDLNVQMVQGSKVVVNGEVQNISDFVRNNNVPATQLRRAAQIELLKAAASRGKYYIPMTASCGMQMQSNFYKDFVNYGVFDFGVFRD